MKNLPPLPALTSRQEQIFDLIKDRILNRGYGPTIREIAAAVDIRSPNGVMCHLKALEKKGYIHRDIAISRGIRLADRFVKKPTLQVSGQIAAGVPVLAEELSETVNLGDLFAEGNTAFQLVDTAQVNQQRKPGDYVVKDDDGNDVAVIRTLRSAS